jgi:AcrR family transcriptional regulator
MIVTLMMNASPAHDGRSRRRLEGMRRVQEAALGLFAARGFDGVSVEEIAQAAGVGAATVYRGFGTKEQIVLWDEYDPALLEGIDARLRAKAPLLEAVREALEAALSEIYARDRDRILRRARLVTSTPALAAAAASDRKALGAALSDLFLRRRACRDPLAADVASGAVVAALEAAIRHWLRLDGRAPLARVLRAAFARLTRLHA